MNEQPRIGVVGATGAVGRVTLELLRERGHDHVRAFASARSAGTRLGELEVEEATPDALGAGDLDVLLFSIGTSQSRELVPPAAEAGALCVDKSSAFRLENGIPLVVPEVNGERAGEHRGIVANPNCSLDPAHDGARAAARRRPASAASASRPTSQCPEPERTRWMRLRGERPDEHDLRMDWDFDGFEFDEESKIREETRKILELPELPISPNCVRVPVLVGHAESVWIETEEPLSPDDAERVLAAAQGVRLEAFPSPGKAAGGDEVLVGRIREDTTTENGLVLFLACDNLRKGAALNAIQIVELLVLDVAPCRVVEPPGPRRQAGLRCGAGAGAGWKASDTLRRTFSRVPSSTGWRPPSSRRASSIRPAVRTVRKPKSARKSRGKTVRWTRKRSAGDVPSR